MQIPKQNTLVQEFGFLFHILSYLGIVETPKETLKRKIFKHFVRGFLVFFYIHVLLASAIYYNTTYQQFRYACIILLNYTSSVIILFILSRRKKCTTKLLRQLTTRIKIPEKIALNICAIVIICLGNLNAFTLINSKHDIVITKYLFYDIESSITYLLGSINATVMSFLYPTLVNLVCLLYCELCRRCSSLIATNRSLAKQLVRHKFDNRLLVEVIQGRDEIVSIIRTLQKEFSIAITLACLTAFTTCFSVISVVLKDTKKHFQNYSDISLSLTSVFMSFSVLMSVIGFAAAVPREMKELCEILRQVCNSKLFQKSYSQNLCVIQTLNYEPEVTLSASEILHFTRKSAISVIGTLLTYNLLILGMISH